MKALFLITDSFDDLQLFCDYFRALEKGVDILESSIEVPGHFSRWDYLFSLRSPRVFGIQCDHGAYTTDIVHASSQGIRQGMFQPIFRRTPLIPCDGSSSLTTDAPAAPDYAVAKEVNLSNNNWGGYGSSDTVNASPLKIESAGHITVNATGNCGSDDLGDDNHETIPASSTRPSAISAISSPWRPRTTMTRCHHESSLSVT